MLPDPPNAGPPSDNGSESSGSSSPGADNSPPPQATDAGEDNGDTPEK